MNGDKKIIDYLNQALKHELTVVSQFWLHFRLMEDWGYGKLGKKWRAESIEEMEHADALIERILFLCGHPNLQSLNPLKIGENIHGVLDSILSPKTTPARFRRKPAKSATRRATT